MQIPNLPDRLIVFHHLLPLFLFGIFNDVYCSSSLIVFSLPHYRFTNSKLLRPTCQLLDTCSGALKSEKY